MLKIKVKVGKVTNLSDARYCAGMGVDMLGFPVGSHDGIDPKKYKEITDWVSVPAFVLEWTDDRIPSNFEDIIQSYNVNFVQIDARLLPSVSTLKIPLIITLAIEDWLTYQSDLERKKDRIAYLILKNPGDGVIDPILIGAITKTFSVLLGFGISENTIESLVMLPAAGISLEGTEESKPGLKDYSHLSGILERLEFD